MLSRIFQLLLVTCLTMGTSRAANDPFVGKWKVNPSKSKLNDEMKVEVAGANRYAFTFGPGQVDTVPTLDEVIGQYILEALTAFNREAYFAAAVMVGAASEKAIYLLAASLLSALKPSRRRTTLETALTKRQLFALLDCVRKTIEDGSASNPASIPYSVSEGASAHLASLFEAIRTQRNDAVHPMNATVSATSVRFLLCSFPYALGTTEKLRAWLDGNPAAL